MLCLLAIYIIIIIIIIEYVLTSVHPGCDYIYIYIYIIISSGEVYLYLLRVYLYIFFIIIILLETRRSRVSTNMAAAHQRDVICYRTGSNGRTPFRLRPRGLYQYATNRTTTTTLCIDIFIHYVRLCVRDSVRRIV